MVNNAVGEKIFSQYLQEVQAAGASRISRVGPIEPAEDLALGLEEVIGPW